MPIYLLYYLPTITKPSLRNYPSSIKKTVLPIYWAVLTFILLKPAHEMPSHFWFVFSGMDKFVHFFTFSLLGLLMKTAYPKISCRIFFLVGLSYGVFTELAQYFMNMGRTGDVWDLVADMLGFGFIYWVFHRLRFKN